MHQINNMQKYIISSQNKKKAISNKISTDLTITNDKENISQTTIDQLSRTVGKTT